MKCYVKFLFSSRKGVIPGHLGGNEWTAGLDYLGMSQVSGGGWQKRLPEIGASFLAVKQQICADVLQAAAQVRKRPRITLFKTSHPYSPNGFLVFVV